ncbi:hypothetical protein [Lysinibacillus capsici]|uniref:hypothetical protein n=1 Tax=Lysinibacillus capsici TaxID=2115968 RepID=UPI00325FC51B
MRKLEFLGEFYEAERIVKEDNSITGYIDNLKVFSFQGITDFSLFKFDDEEIFDLDENSLLKERLKSVEEALMFLMELNII